MQTDQTAEHSGRSYALRGRVLLADPDIVATASIARQFRGCGYAAVIATSSNEALQIVSRKSIDLALIELKFDDGDCLELISAIRLHNPCSRLVVHTWFADVKATVAVVKAGADDLLPKPLNAEFVVEFLVNGDRLAMSSQTSLPDTESVRRAHIETVFGWSGRNVSLASRRLSLNRRSLQRLMQRYRETA
ncbi:response regulator [Rhizobium sp. BG4]|uniref:response regulator transcription factor n=1 Tax=Rhizobium sp. BG4 TaxID=2613770 RepID=UPI00193E61F5|nr:response regulator [Rhizobium sp. BG4]QRM45785.1 response regulator [Rhizobium sp. BG4]